MFFSLHVFNQRVFRVTCDHVGGGSPWRYANDMGVELRDLAIELVAQAAMQRGALVVRHLWAELDHDAGDFGATRWRLGDGGAIIGGAGGRPREKAHKQHAP